MSTVGVVFNPKVGKEHLRRLTGALGERGVEVAEVIEDADGGPTRLGVDLVFVLGGDGTMLRASRMYPGKVLLGVKLGRVGFMSGILPEELEAGVEKAVSGGLDVQEYRMLDVRVEGTDKTFLAANDAALMKQRPHQIAAIEVSVNGENLFSFRCDGFVASTPLGSTAYALSAGGPIVSGDARCYVLVPIAPHALVSRPLVLGDEQVARLTLRERSGLLSLDGGEPVEVPEDGVVSVRLSEKSVRIGRTDEWSWWRALRRTFL